jgi:hypothetical protein
MSCGSETRDRKDEDAPRRRVVKLPRGGSHRPLPYFVRCISQTPSDFPFRPEMPATLYIRPSIPIEGHGSPRGAELIFPPSDSPPLPRLRPDNQTALIPSRPMNQSQRFLGCVIRGRSRAEAARKNVLDSGPRFWSAILDRDSRPRFSTAILDRDSRQRSRINACRQFAS